MFMTTRGDTENDLAKFQEMGCKERTVESTEGGSDITRIVCPKSDGSSPRFRTRVTVLNVLRDLVPREPPDGNLGIVPKHSENATRSHVERMTSTSFAVGKSTASVVAARAQALG